MIISLAREFLNMIQGSPMVSYQAVARLDCLLLNSFIKGEIN